MPEFMPNIDWEIRNLQKGRYPQDDYFFLGKPNHKVGFNIPDVWLFLHLITERINNGLCLVSAFITDYM